jgi:hypothetical protein
VCVYVCTADGRQVAGGWVTTPEIDIEAASRQVLLGVCVCVCTWGFVCESVPEIDVEAVMRLVDDVRVCMCVCV